MRKNALFVIVAAGSLAIACDAIIGTRDVAFDPNAGDGGGGGGSTIDGSGTSTIDGSMMGTGMDGGGGLDAGPNTCNSPDLTTDRKNCGACGIDCTNGTCAKGICTVVSGVAGSQSIALDDNKVYMAVGGGYIQSCAKNGCGTAQVLFQDTNNLEPLRVQVAGGELFFSNYYDNTTYPTAVYRMLTDGGGGAPQRLSPLGYYNVAEFAMTGDGGSTLYFSDDDVDINGTLGLHTCVLGNCTDAGAAKIDTSTIRASLLLANGDYVWAGQAGVHYCVAPATNCAAAPMIFKDPSSVPVSLAWDFQNKRIIIGNAGPNGGDDYIVTCPQGTAVCNGAPALSPKTLHYPRSMVAVGNFFYYVEAGTFVDDMTPAPNDGVLWRCELDATGTSCSNAVKMADQLPAPASLVWDGDVIFWVNEGKIDNFGSEGSVMKIHL